MPTSHQQPAAPSQQPAMILQQQPGMTFSPSQQPAMWGWIRDFIEQAIQPLALEIEILKEKIAKLEKKIGSLAKDEIAQLKRTPFTFNLNYCLVVPWGEWFYSRCFATEKIFFNLCQKTWDT